MTDLQSAVLAMERSNAAFQPRIHLVRGKLGLPNQVVVTSRSKYHWVRLFGDRNSVVQAYNDKTNPTYDLDVYVAVDPYRMEGKAPFVVMGTVATIGTSMDALLDNKSKVEEVTGAHAWSHIWSEANRGRDAIEVHPRAIVPLRVQPLDTPGMQLYVNPGYYTHQGVTQWFRGTYTDEISAPAAGVRYDLVTLDPATNEVSITTGTPATDIYTPPAVPAVPTGKIPLAYVSIARGMTEIAERHIFDMRPFCATNSLKDHDHSVGIETGGQLIPENCLTATGEAAGLALLTNGAGGVTWGEVPLGDRLAIFCDRKTGNTSGGSCTGNVTYTRVLNTTIYNPGQWATLASNRVTLQPGKYLWMSWSPGTRCVYFKSWLYSYTDSAAVADGTSEISDDDHYYTTHSKVFTALDIASAKAYEVRWRSSETRADIGLGTTSWQGTDVYTVVVIIKLE